MSVSNKMKKMMKDFMKFAGCHTRNNLGHHGNVAFNSLETAFVYLLNTYLLATLWRVNGFSQNIQHLLDMAKEKIARLLHA